MRDERDQKNGAGAQKRVVAKGVFDDAPDERVVYDGIRETLEEARRKTARAVDTAIVDAYWSIGRQIHEAVGDRAAYGKSLLKYLSARLTGDFGKGFSERSLRQMRQFYQAFPIRNALRTELSWTHYRHLSRVQPEPARLWYMNKAADAHWSERELGRQIATSLYERLLRTQNHGGGATSTSSNSGSDEPASDAHPIDPLSNIFKEPYVLEFVGLDSSPYLESDLEQALTNSLQEFLLELGDGFAFVARQQRVTDGEDDYYIDLVFYNYLLNCFVLIDLKTGKLTPQDVGQMDFYRRLYDGRYRPKSANPTVAVILCARRNETVARYSALSDCNEMLAAEYLTHLPSEDELARVVERNRRKFEATRGLLPDSEPDGPDEADTDK